MILWPVMGFETVLLATFPVSVSKNVGNANCEASNTGVVEKLTTTVPQMSAATALRALTGPLPPLVGPAQNVFAA